MITTGLIQMLCCPKTRQRVAEAGPELVQRVNDLITAGTVKTCCGSVITGRLESALMTADGKFLYPVRQGVPMMLWEEAISVPN